MARALGLEHPLVGAPPQLGVIGGSGLYAMPGLRDVERVRIDTPWGEPSDEIVVGTLGGVRAAFLPRHGRGHRMTPSEVPYRANIAALKHLGVAHVVAVTAVGSLREDFAPGHLVTIDQLIDRTVGRPRTFFEGGIVGHVSFGDPVCAVLRAQLDAAARGTGAVVLPSGTYVCIEGPTFSTKAESRLFRTWGADVVGMTVLPEARLAREAGLSYAALALVTDYDCWHESEEAVSAAAVVEAMKRNVASAQATIAGLAESMSRAALPRPYADVLKDALMTAPEAMPAEARARLSFLWPTLETR